jgi:hypothetical protein
MADAIEPRLYVIITGVPRPEPRTVCEHFEIVTEIPGLPRYELQHPPERC